LSRDAAFPKPYWAALDPLANGVQLEMEFEFPEKD